MARLSHNLPVLWSIRFAVNLLSGLDFPVPLRKSLVTKRPFSGSSRGKVFVCIAVSLALKKESDSTGNFNKPPDSTAAVQK